MLWRVATKAGAQKAGLQPINPLVKNTFSVCQRCPKATKAMFAKIELKSTI